MKICFEWLKTIFLKNALMVTISISIYLGYQKTSWFYT